MKYNNAESTLAGDITASGTAIVLKTGEGDLFPSTGYPEKFKIEHFEGSVVTKREVLTVSGRTGDILTISDRASEPCVQDESLATKTRTQDAYSFSSGDTISMTITESDYNGIIDNFNTFKNTTVPNTYATKDEVKKSELVYGSSSTGTDDYAITVSGITAYQDGMTFRVKSDVANTGACTLDVNGIGAKAVKKQQGTVDLTDGDWAANGIATLVYNSDLDCFQFEGEVVNVVDIKANNIQDKFLLGEDISIGEAICIENKNESDFSSIQNIGQSISNKRVALKVIGSEKISDIIKIYAKKTGSPGNIGIRIETDNSGKPSGTLVDANATTTIAHGSFGTSLSIEDIYFPGTFSVSEFEEVWIVFYVGTYGSETTDASNYYSIGYDTIQNKEYIKFERAPDGIDLIQTIFDSGYLSRPVGKYGLRISVQNDVYIKSFDVVFNGAGSITNPRIENSAGTTIYTGTYSSGVVSFNEPVLLSSGTEYQLVGETTMTGTGNELLFSNESDTVFTDFTAIGSINNGSFDTSRFILVGTITTQGIGTAYGSLYDDKNFFISSTLFKSFVYKANASSIKSSNFLGFINGTFLKLNEGDIILFGLNKSFSGLSVGEDYFLANVDGGISMTPGTNSVKVGKAVSPTTLLINSGGF